MGDRSSLASQKSVAVGCDGGRPLRIRPPKKVSYLPRYTTYTNCKVVHEAMCVVNGLVARSWALVQYIYQQPERLPSTAATFILQPQKPGHDFGRFDSLLPRTKGTCGGSYASGAPENPMLHSFKLASSVKQNERLRLLAHNPAIPPPTGLHHRAALVYD